MPGLCLIASPPESTSLGPLLAEMMARMKHFTWYQEDSHVDDAAGIALGRLSLGFVNVAPQPAWNEDHTLVAVMEGEIYNHAELRNELTSAGHRFTDGSQAEVLLHGYEQAGKEFFRRIEGKYIAAIWDSRAQRLFVVNDRFGMQPFYYVQLAGTLIAASEIKALLADPRVPRTENPRGLAQFFTFGHLYAEDTLLKAVKALPPAAWLTYEPREDRLTVERYWRWNETAPPTFRSQGEFLDRIDADLQRAVDRRVGDTKALGISLSGGLDARTILGLIDHRNVSVKSVSLGVEGSLDHRCARQLAALTNGNHHCYHLDAGVLTHWEQHLRRMVHLTDGHYLDQCIVMPSLPLYRELGIEVLLRGHAGELMHMDKAYNFSLDAEGWGIRDGSSLQTWLGRHLSAYMLENVEGPLFTKLSRAQMDSLAHESLNECLAESQGVEPSLQRVWHLFVTQRLRRETAMSMAKIGSLFETRLPFLDSDVVSTLLAAPPEWKRGDAIQAHILRRARPEFLRVVNANNGAPLGSGRLRQRFSTFRMKVLGRLGVPGYQPYERLGLWLRRELRPLVSELLLSDRCLDRGLFSPETVRKVVQDHFEHRQNHTALVLAMMIFEAGQREFMDGENYLPPPVAAVRSDRAVTLAAS